MRHAGTYPHDPQQDYFGIADNTPGVALAVPKGKNADSWPSGEASFGAVLPSVR